MRESNKAVQISNQLCQTDGDNGTQMSKNLSMTFRKHLQELDTNGRNR